MIYKAAIAIIGTIGVIMFVLMMFLLFRNLIHNPAQILFGLAILLPMILAIIVFIIAVITGVKFEMQEL